MVDHPSADQRRSARADRSIACQDPQSRVRRIRTIGFGLVMIGCLGHRRPTAQKKAPSGAKVLLLTGGQRQHHGYRDQALYLAEALEDTGRYEVTIGEDAAILETPAPCASTT